MRSRFFFSAILILTFAAPSLFGQDGPPQPATGADQSAPGARPHRPLPKPVNLKVLPKDTAPES
jgi:hypothetical protein